MVKKKRGVAGSSSKMKKASEMQKAQKMHNFIYENFLCAWDYIKEIKRYIWFSTILFFALAVIGYLFPIFFVDQVKKLVENLLLQTQGLNTLQLIRFIIMNNLQSALAGIAFGFLFGIVSIGILVINGYVLGFVAAKSVGSQGIFVLWRLLPHGIFEIPAIMISVGMGIRLGMFLFVYHEKDKGKEFLRWVINSVKVFIFIIIPLLVIAGIIEGSLIGMMG